MADGARGRMTLEKETTDLPASEWLLEVEEILRRDLAMAQKAYAAANPEDRALARHNYLKALSRFADLVMEKKIPPDLQRGSGRTAE